MRRLSRWYLFSILVASLAGCAQGTDPGFSAAPLAPGQVLSTTATIRFLNLEGGCWSLETSEGRYKPIDLPVEFRVDGLEVSVVLRDAPDMADICMIGPLVHVDLIAESA